MPSTESTSERGRRRQLIAAALELFAARGFAGTSMADVAAAAGVALDETFRLFGRKEAFALALYHRLAVNLEARAGELPTGSLAERFAAAMRMKFELLAPHRGTLMQLLPAAVDPEDRLGALSEHTERIRARVLGVFQSVVQGASDCPDQPTSVALARSLYGVHLGLVFLWLQDSSPGASSTDEALALVTQLLTMVGPLLAGVDWAGEAVARVDRVIGPLVQPPHDAAHFSRAQNILRVIFRHRRLLDDNSRCQAKPCGQCFALHLPKVENAIRREQPVHLLLPGFPAKSANRSKTLGPLPDLGEELSLRFLVELCAEVQQIHPSAARVTICSDGRVFNDLVGVRDDDVSAYRVEIERLIELSSAEFIDTFDLDDVFSTDNHDASRQQLADQYAEPLETVIDRVHRFGHHRALFNGIHRFVFEDQAELHPSESRTQVRKAAKQTAYEVIRRSNAWSRLIAECFPDALRLSIHPQDPHSEKIGILLTHGEDQWITPWHGCVLLDDQRYTLVRRKNAEECGAQLVMRDGRASHYESSAHKESKCTVVN